MAPNPGAGGEKDETGASETPGSLSHETIESLFLDHNRSLLLFVNAIVRDWQEAKEVVQEAYVKLLRLDQRQAVSLPVGLLFRTAENLSRDRVRRRLRRERHEPTVRFFYPPDDESPSPEASVIAQEQIAKAVAALPPKCRLAFILVELEAKPLEEAAAYMGIMVGSVRQLLHRAYQHLAETLETLEENTRGTR